MGEVRTIRPDEQERAVELLALLNPDTDRQQIQQRFHAILSEHPHYFPIGAFEDNLMVGFVGAWIATRVWCGRYLEIDNFVVHPDHRSSGIGTRLIQHLENLALERGCDVVTLDTYTSHHAAHRLYHRLGYSIVGYHFVKSLTAPDS